jgi:hypothetical protein
MPYRARISTLEDSYKLVEDQIFKLEKAGNPDPKKLANLREASVRYNMELKRMIRAQWDHEHDSVDLSDD